MAIVNDDDGPRDPEHQADQREMGGGDADHNRDDVAPFDRQLIAKDGEGVLFLLEWVEVGHRCHGADRELGHSSANAGGAQVVGFPVGAGWR